MTELSKPHLNGDYYEKLTALSPQMCHDRIVARCQHFHEELVALKKETISEIEQLELTEYEKECQQQIVNAIDYLISYHYELFEDFLYD
jgi:hypothetical protein